ncbi:MAG: ABC transporter permease [Spirochaetaceae bacterium]|jgi:putative ABC transport system permease protein|nr:ABC transporter permease [Spirochaetaceae bacterium]
MIEDLLFAFRMFRRNKTRTFLSLLGVIIGVASVIIIGTLGESATGNIKKSLGSSNLNMIQVSTGFMRRARENRIRLDESFRSEIFGSVPGIKKIWPKNTIGATLSNGDLDFTGNLYAVEYGFVEMAGLALGKGRYFGVSDDVEGTQTIILGSEAANMLFPDSDDSNGSDGNADNVIGAQILVQAGDTLFGFKVIGVLTGTASGFESPEMGLYIPRGFYTKKIDPSPDAAQVVVEAMAPHLATRIVDDLRSYALAKTGDQYALQVNSMQAMLEQFDEVTGTMSLLLSGIAAISLLVGGIGIMNIMIVTVTERKREIGIRKAIGASPAVIRTQFLVESAAITVLGGILGLAFGLALSAVIVAVLKWTFAIALPACVAAFLFSAFVGIFFGFYPASRAAKLDPVEALAAE